MREHRLLWRAGDVISLAPPLCITKDEVDYLVQQVDEVIGEVEKELS
jgi:adenosylmethionine-8-amino-7-oxononanoate aminotransferase